MKKSHKSFISLLLTLVMVFSCFQSAFVGVTALGDSDITYELSEEWAVQGKYCYVYLYAKNIEGLQSGSVVISYDKSNMVFYTTKSEAVKSAGLLLNPYLDDMFLDAGLANGYKGDNTKGYVSLGFAMNDSVMTAAETSIPENGKIPLYKFVFKSASSAPVGDYAFEIVKAKAEVNEKNVDANVINSTVHVAKRLVNQFNTEVGYLTGQYNNANPQQPTNCRFNLFKSYPEVTTVNFDLGAENKSGGKPAAIAFNAFGDSAAGSKLSGLETIIFSVPVRNLDSNDTYVEYPYRAFSDLDNLQRVIMEFSEEDTNEYSRYFTDDGIIYIRDIDADGNYLDTSKIYFVPPARESDDIYLSDKVSGIYGNITGNALMYLSQEKLEKLTFHVFEGAEPNGVPQDIYFNGNYVVSGSLRVKLNAVKYEPKLACKEVEYNCDSASELRIPYVFNGYMLNTANSAEGLKHTKGNNYITMASADIMALAKKTLSAGKDSVTLNIAIQGLSLVDEINIKFVHTCARDGGTVVKSPTCTETGTKEFKCSVCGKFMANETIPALGHKSDAGTVTKQNNCTENGEKVYKCTVCGETVKKEAIPATGHKSDNGTVTVKPTCTETGIKVYKCTVCGVEVKTETVPATGHSDKEIGTVKSATCRAAGVKRYECTVCGVVTDKSYSDSNAHIWVKDFGLIWKCSVCGSTKVNSSKPGSSYVENVIKEPTKPTETEPPVTNPPVTEPPVTEPPVTEPPVTNPPVTEPPVTAPPVTTPPVTKPPVSTPTLPDTSDVNKTPVFTDSRIIVKNGCVLVPPMSKTELDAVSSETYKINDSKGLPKTDGALVAGDTLICSGNSYKILVLFDADGNGKITSADARIILRCTLRLENISDDIRFAVTADETRKPTSSDARKALRVALRLDTI